jgi:hypothetical protein
VFPVTWEEFVAAGSSMPVAVGDAGSSSPHYEYQNICDLTGSAAVSWLQDVGERDGDSCLSAGSAVLATSTQRQLLDVLAANVMAWQRRRMEEEVAFLASRQTVYADAILSYMPASPMLFMGRAPSSRPHWRPHCDESLVDLEVVTRQEPSLRKRARLADDDGRDIGGEVKVEQVGFLHNELRCAPWPTASCAPSSFCRLSAFAEIIEPSLLAFLRDHDISTEVGARAFRTEFSHLEAPNVYSFPFFTRAFCAILAGEVKNFEASTLPRFRPNSMNRYGLILNEIGLKPFLDELCQCVMFPIGEMLFPEQLSVASSRAAPPPHETPATTLLTAAGDVNGEGAANPVRDDHLQSSSRRGEGEGSRQRRNSPQRHHRRTCCLDAHHTFVVEYRHGGDTALDMHSDDSEITFNVNLVDSFEGSSLRFCGMPGTAGHRTHARCLEHSIGRAVVHPGALRHGALPITQGERMNLIVWMTSTWLRQHCQPALGGQPGRYPISDAKTAGHPPDPLCVSVTHDPDHAIWLKRP